MWNEKPGNRKSLRVGSLKSGGTVWRAWFCLSVLVIGQSPATAEPSTEDESLLKAAFVYNFAKFTRWPANRWSESTTFRLCIAGKDDLVDSLGRLVGEKVKGRPVEIIAFEVAEDREVCHVFYIASSEHGRYAGLLQRVSDVPVLTVSGIRGFADAGGMIQLYRSDDRIRFKINHAVARGRGLEFSARLLDLAELVDERAVP